MLRNRKQKIEFLRGLTNGTRNVSELSTDEMFYVPIGATNENELTAYTDKRHSQKHIDAIIKKSKAGIIIGDGSYINLD